MKTYSRTTDLKAKLETQFELSALYKKITPPHSTKLLLMVWISDVCKHP
jgi:hypothetical protein